MQKQSAGEVKEIRPLVPRFYHINDLSFRKQRLFFQ
jgi:hypothetical protein